jgi:hypothetical protein
VVKAVMAITVIYPTAVSSIMGAVEVTAATGKVSDSATKVTAATAEVAATAVATAVAAATAMTTASTVTTACLAETGHQENRRPSQEQCAGERERFPKHGMPPSH